MKSPMQQEQVELYRRHHPGMRVQWVRNKYHCIKSRAKKKDILFDISFEWYLSKYLAGCSLTGIHFSRQKTGNPTLDQFYRCSIDRKNPENGYIQSNCHLILQGLNVLKQRKSLSLFRHEVRKHMADIILKSGIFSLQHP